MTGRQAQRKGASGERELAALLSAMFNADVRRGSSPYLPGIIAPDILGLPGVHIEVKRRGLFSLPSAMRQSQADAAPGETPIVCHRGNVARWLVTCELSDLPRLADAVTRLTRPAHDPTA